MKTSLWHSLCTAILIVVMGLAAPATSALDHEIVPAQPVKPVQPAHLQGTFLQLLNAHGEWKTDQWAELFSYFHELHLSHLVLQWTVSDQTAFYPATQLHPVVHPPLEIILQMADEADIEVSVGLVYDSSFWKNISRSPAEVDTYLKGLQSQSISVATEIAPLLRKHRSFKEWYIPQEVDDINWRTPEAQNILFSYLRDLSAFLHLLTPAARIAVSGFANAGTDPKFLEGFWNTLLQKAPAIDSVLFQDGIGTGKLTLSTVAPYLSAVRSATDARGREFHTIVEIFRQTGGQPVNAGPFRAIPASLEQILHQLTVAAPYSSHAIIFSMPEYMSPVGGPEANELYESYLTEDPHTTK